MLNYDRLDPIIVSIILNNYATLKELRDEYDIYEVLDLYELCCVSAYNQHQMMEASKNGAKR